MLELVLERKRQLNLQFSVGRFKFSDKYIRQQPEFRQLEYRASGSPTALGAIIGVPSRSREFLVNDPYGDKNNLYEFGMQNMEGLKKGGLRM